MCQMEVVGANGRCINFESSCVKVQCSSKPDRGMRKAAQKPAKYMTRQQVAELNYYNRVWHLK